MKLTERQQKIADLRAAYTPVKVIAKMLGISPHTVKEAIRVGNRKQDGKVTRPNVDQFVARQEKTLAMLQSGCMSSAEIGEQFPGCSDRQTSRMINRMSNAGLIVMRGRGRTAMWYTPENHAKAVERDAAMFAQAKIDAAAKREAKALEAAEANRRGVRAKVSKRAVKSVAPQVNMRPTVDGVSTAPAAWNGAEMIVTDRTVVTRKEPPPSRFAPEPGFARAITSDWALRRQGVEIESRFAGVY